MTQPGFSIHPRSRTDGALVAQFAELPTSIISDNLSRLNGTWSLKPFHRTGTRLIGQALTVRVRSGDNLMIHKALQMGGAGDVLVIDGQGCLDRALMGEIMKRVAQARKFSGLVIDGAIRDVSAYLCDDFPCYAKGVSHRGPYKDGPGEINVPVCIDGTVVHPGDVVVGDDDGVVFVSAAQASEVAAASRAKAHSESLIFQAIADNAYDDAWVDQTLREKNLVLTN